MKYLKTYKQINEGLRDMMKPKSKEEVLSNFNKSSSLNKIKLKNKYNLDDTFKISDEEILKELDNLSTEDRISFVYTNKLDDKYLPPDEEIWEHINKLSSFNKKMTFLLRYGLSDKFKLPDDEIKNFLSGMSVSEKMYNINRFGLDRKFMPSDEEFEEVLSDLNLDLDSKISKIRRWGLDKKFMPSDEEIKEYLSEQSIYHIIDLYYKSAIDRNLFPTDRIDEFFKNLSPLQRYHYVSEYRFDKKYLPSDEEVEDYISKIDYKTWENESKYSGVPKKFRPN